ncbi:penicillin-binding protein activator LpoB [Nissabacter sp. SGAir0207]|uniref:penicillin-binding protein activator LpoB n=1 Tax=Nissabacter sp. SGAir0207 TaxID=2126321 RepID=UPI0010CD189E|nr:penicillin-binding protein activator LpoB [Nissabacter sp. SGAir0207]QCR36426.1 penicillin-binding protein activator LpoB [Nissabacter sp. SGAir0207]
MKKFLFVAAAALILSGCINRPAEEPQAPVTTIPGQPQPTQPVPPQPQPQPTQPTPTDTVPQPPKMQKPIDWQASVQPLIAQMLRADGVESGSVLLLDNVKNSTNGRLQTGAATSALYNALASNNTFSVVPASQLTQAKQTLGLSADDSLVSRSKAIGLARYLKAQYVLYSDASGSAKAPTLEMQLMLVQTGEIVWSGSGDTQR